MFPLVNNRSPLHVYVHRPNCLCFCGVHLRAWLTMVAFGFQRVCPIHAHSPILLFWSLIGWLLLLHVSLLENMHVLLCKFHHISQIYVAKVFKSVGCCCHRTNYNVLYTETLELQK